MKALVFHGPKSVKVESVKDPEIERNRDAIIRVTSTAICGSDLHIYNGLFPQLRNMVLGHEFMGVVEEVGKGVHNLKKGDRVVVPFPVACGGCWFCQHQLPGHCENSNVDVYGPEGGVFKDKGGGLFGYTDLYGGYDGGQAEYVRVPFADFGPRKVPEWLTDEQTLFLTDILPTGYSGVDWAGVKGGEIVAVFGCGPVGIMAMKSAWLRGASRVIGVDILPYRLDRARTTANAEIINASEVDAVEAIRELSGGKGADVCIDAVGMEADRNLLDRVQAVKNLEIGSIKVLRNCISAVRRGGFVSILGVYGTPFDNFPLHQIFDKGIGIKGGQAPVHKYIDHLLQMVSEHKIRLDDVISHKMPLSEAANAYKIFNKKEDDCVKVVLHP